MIFKKWRGRNKNNFLVFQRTVYFILNPLESRVKGQTKAGLISTRQMFNNTLLLHLPLPILPSFTRWVVSLFLLSNSLMWPNREKKKWTKFYPLKSLILKRQWLTDSASFDFNVNIDNFHSFVDPFDFLIEQLSSLQEDSFQKNDYCNGT